MASPSLPEVKRAEYHQRCASVREILRRSANFSLGHIAERISCSAVTKLQRESGARMTNKFFLNDAKRWRAAAPKTHRSRHRRHSAPWSKIISRRMAWSGVV
jgi:hypothetical protein